MKRSTNALIFLPETSPTEDQDLVLKCVSATDVTAEQFGHECKPFAFGYSVLLLTGVINYYLTGVNMNVAHLQRLL